MVSYLVGATDLAPARDMALKRCCEQIKWYDTHAHQAWLAFTIFQVATVVLGGLTPILLLWATVPKPIQAVPAVLAAVAAGVNGIFHWREDHTRFACVREALKSEQVKFETRTTKEYGVGVDDAQALDHFVTNMEALAIAEIGQWRTLWLTQKTAAADKQTDKAG